MNTIRSSAALALLSLLALAAAALAQEAAPPEPREDTVLILHTNDTHAHLLPDAEGRGGMARIGGYVEKVRSERPDVLFLDAGDAVTGTPVSSIFRGRPMFQVMSVMGYDAMALGNHEFDHGPRLVPEYRELAAFPLLAANAKGSDGALLADAASRVFDVDGVRVGVLGVVTEKTPELTGEGCTEGVTFRPPAEALRPLVPEIEKRSDLVVVLSHLGYREDRALAAAVPGIDVIVGGHSHTTLEKPVRVGETIVVQAGAYTRYVGRLDLRVDLDRGRVVAAEGSLVPVDASLPESEATAKAVARWEKAVAERVDVTIGVAKRARSKRELQASFEEVFRRVLGTDTAFHNPGGVRTDLPAGPISIRRIWTILPFENTLVTLRIRGAKLPGWARERLGEVDPERIYTVATNSYAAGHPDQYFSGGVEGRVESGRQMRDTVIDWVREHGDLP